MSFATIFKSLFLSGSFNSAKRIKIAFVVITISGLLVSCANDIEKVKILSVTEVLPSLTAEGYEMLYSDSTVIRFKLQTPELLRHDNEKEPYTEFPSGVNIIKYDANMNVISSISALYAKNFDSDDRWEVKNDVVAVNLKGDTLKTEYLVWDQKKGKIYSNQFVKIIQKDQVYTGIGFESDQDFSSYKIKNLKGQMYVDVDDN